ncbi:MAG: GNAT family N-acetyltransferase [Pseudomonadota bacterium]
MQARFIILQQGDEAYFDQIADGVFDDEVSADFARTFLSDPRHHICVALADGVIVGFASAVDYIHPDKPHELWINEVGVAPSFQRRGLGATILRCLMDHAKSLGCAEAWVLTDRSNIGARAFYRQLRGEEEETMMITFDFADRH